MDFTLKGLHKYLRILIYVTLSGYVRLVLSSPQGGAPLTLGWFIQPLRGKRSSVGWVEAHLYAP